MVDQLGGAGVADQVAELDLQLADPPVDRGEHPAIAQIDLGIFDRGLGPGDFRLGVVDVDPVVGLGLFQAGLIGLDLGRALLALGFGLVVIVLRRGLARQQVSLAALLDLVETQLGLIECQLGLRDLRAFEAVAFLERRLGRRELCLGLLELHLVRLFLDHEQELTLLDVLAILEMLSSGSPSPEPGSSHR